MLIFQTKEEIINLNTVTFIYKKNYSSSYSSGRERKPALVFCFMADGDDTTIEFSSTGARDVAFNIISANMGSDKSAIIQKDSIEKSVKDSASQEEVKDVEK